MAKVVRNLSVVLCLLTNLLLAACTNTQPQRFTIGILNPRSSYESLIKNFQVGMTDLGYIEGDNVVYAYEDPIGNSTELAQMAQALVAAKVDLIFALGTPATIAAQSAVRGTDIPVIFAPLHDPVGSGVVKSLPHPGGNLTGISTGGYVPKELEWLLLLAPQTREIFVPYNPADDISAQSLAILYETAAHFSVELLVYEVHSTTDAITAATTIPTIADAILLLPTSLVLDQIDLFTEVAIQRKLPLAVPTFPYVEAGALVAYGSDYAAIGIQVGRLADKILQGVAPADLPVETAEFYLGINLQTAQAIGLYIPDAIVQQAMLIVRE